VFKHTLLGKEWPSRNGAVFSSPRPIIVAGRDSRAFTSTPARTLSDAKRTGSVTPRPALVSTVKSALCTKVPSYNFRGCILAVGDRGRTFFAKHAPPIYGPELPLPGFTSLRPVFRMMQRRCLNPGQRKRRWNVERTCTTAPERGMSILPRQSAVRFISHHKNCALHPCCAYQAAPSSALRRTMPFISSRV
jgi:hypothetical protein